MGLVNEAVTIAMNKHERDTAGTQDTIDDHAKRIDRIEDQCGAYLTDSDIPDLDDYVERSDMTSYVDDEMAGYARRIEQLEGQVRLLVGTLKAMRNAVSCNLDALADDED